MTLGGRWRFVLLAFWICGCGISDLSETPLWSGEVIDKILVRAENEGCQAPAKASRFEVSLHPGKDQILRVSGRVRRVDTQGEGSIGPVEFIVELNGRTVEERKLRTRDSHASVEFVIDLSRFEGKKVEAVFIQKNQDPEGTESAWNRISVENRLQVRRRAAAEGPNVLFLMVDTVRADHCSLYGYGRQTTPNLDLLAAESLVFDHAVAPAAWTLPSVASILTGRYPVEMRTVDGAGLRPKDVTIQKLLLDEGFTTMAVSTNPLIGPGHGFDHGFETFVQIPWERATAVNRRFSKWLETAVSTQWFAYLHYIDPHDPYEAPQPFLGQFSDPAYRGEFLRKWALNEIADTVNYGMEAAFPVDESDLVFLRDRYDEEIRYWDSTLGQLIDDLERNQVLDRTLIVVVSDHGEEFADHGRFKHGRSLFQETIHVPLLISFPGAQRVGRRSDAVEARLLMPSLLTYLGVESPPGIRGNLFRLAEGRGQAVSYSRYTVRPDDPNTRMGLASHVQGPWKLIHETDVEGDFLFDLAHDPDEIDEVGAGNPEALEAGLRSLEEWSKAHPRPEGAKPEISEETLQALRELGYVQ